MANKFLFFYPFNLNSNNPLLPEPSLTLKLEDFWPYWFLDIQDYRSIPWNKWNK